MTFHLLTNWKDFSKIQGNSLPVTGISDADDALRGASARCTAVRYIRCGRRPMKWADERCPFKGIGAAGNDLER